MATSQALRDPIRPSSRTARLPQPSTRARVRKEVVVRPGTPADAPTCALIESAYTTTHIWQLDTKQEAEEVRISFRQIRLPRELTLIAPHRPPSLPAGGQRRGLLWLVAEEIEVGAETSSDRVSDRVEERVADPRAGSAPPAAPQANAPWHHAVRQSASRSSVQLSLPPAGTTLQPRDMSAREHASRSRITGYVVAAAAPKDPNAYLRTLVVDRAHRRKGIAARLLGEAKRWSVRQGASLLMADAPARNYPAQRLLQKAGFTFCGFNDCCYPDREVAVFFSARL